MPVTVQELNINTTVQNEGKEAKSGQEGGNKGGGLGKADKEVIIQECVRRIMEQLEHQKGR